MPLDEFKQAYAEWRRVGGLDRAPIKREDYLKPFLDVGVREYSSQGGVAGRVRCGSGAPLCLWSEDHHLIKILIKKMISQKKSVGEIGRGEKLKNFFQKVLEA